MSKGIYKLEQMLCISEMTKQLSLLADIDKNIDKNRYLVWHIEGKLILFN